MVEIERAGNQALGEAAVKVSPPLTLTASAVATVLHGMLSGEASPEDAQLWASFLRWGYVAEPGGGPVTPLDIDWEEAAEDAIVEALGRLDEIGDLIDGEVSTEEIHQLLAALEETQA